MHAQRSTRQAIAVVLAGAGMATLSACGGDGNADATNADATAPMASDTAPPTTTGSSPVNRSNSVGLPTQVGGDDLVAFEIRPPASVPTAPSSDSPRMSAVTTDAPLSTAAPAPEPIPVVLSADALFGSASAELTEAAAEAIASFARTLPEGRLLVEVVGFTDKRGSAEANYQLGLARAQAVAALFIDALGERAEVSATSEGESQAVGTTAEEMASDRRVEFAVTVS